MLHRLARGGPGMQTRRLVISLAALLGLAGADEDRILAWLRTLRSDLIDPTIAVHHGRVIKRTGDGSIIEFRSPRLTSAPFQSERPYCIRSCVSEKWIRAAAGRRSTAAGSRW
jgi:class 3 adenylate cyclase